jgi:hypothetical protein
VVCRIIGRHMTLLSLFHIGGGRLNGCLGGGLSAEKWGWRVSLVLRGVFFMGNWSCSRRGWLFDSVHSVVLGLRLG